MKHRAACMMAIIAASCCLLCSPAVDRNGELRRVVSLSPSITRQIIDLGMENLLAGVTDDDIPQGKKIPIIGTIVRPNTEIIVTLSPDAVICSEEDAAVQNTAGISSAGVRVVRLPANRDFNGLCDNYVELGRLLGAAGTAEMKAGAYRAERMRMMDAGPGASTDHGAGSKRLRAVFIVSLRPLMTVSGGSFIGNMLNDAGCDNPYGDAAMPYPLISAESLVREDPDVVVSMMPGTVDYFRLTFGNVKIRTLENGTVYEIAPDHVAYYTPADYLAALSEIRACVGAARGKILREAGLRP